MRIQPVDEKINYEAKYREDTFQRVVKTLLSLSQRLLRPCHKMENCILVYCLVKRLFHTFTFSLLMTQHIRPLMHAVSFTCNILFTYANSLYTCLFYCIFRNTPPPQKKKINALFGDISSLQLCSYSLMVLC